MNKSGAKLPFPHPLWERQKSIDSLQSFLIELLDHDDRFLGSKNTEQLKSSKRYHRSASPKGVIDVQGQGHEDAGRF